MQTQHYFPPVIYGTSCLGNLYTALPYTTKLSIVHECMVHTPGDFVVFDSAGKYGAGLALETLGACLDELAVPPEKVLISNKLGWYRTALTGREPLFEPGVWKDLKHDAEQRISFKGILDCYYQGNTLLGNYPAQLLSVHDPDEYLAAASGPADKEKRFHDILEAYYALQELKKKGLAQSIGIGSKDWTVIQSIAGKVDLDWVMIANSLTLHSHPKALIAFIGELHQKNIAVINSAVFNGGFLVGGDHYNYKKADPESSEGKQLYEWRARFFALCNKYSILPAEACFNYGFNIPGVAAVALNTSRPEQVKKNIDMATRQVPEAFWEEMKAAGLL